MINKNKLKLLLHLFIAATFCKGSSVIKKEYLTIGDNVTSIKMTWVEAIKECSSWDKKLITLNTMNETLLTGFGMNLSVVWLGLIRDSSNDSAWNWINTKNGAIISEDLSQSPDWTDGEQSSHCAYIDSDSKWHSRRCVEKHNFYCSDKTEIKHHSIQLSWHEARDYCWEKMGALATVTNRNKNQFEKNAWIGLYRVGGETWQWDTGEAVEYIAWAQNEPVTNDCGVFNGETQKWQSYPCSESVDFICYDDNLVVVNERKTWEEALEHCKSLDKKCVEEPCVIQHKLLTIQTRSEYNYVRARIYEATTDEIWTGLRFLGGSWWWVNGDQVNDEGKLPKCPLQSNHCGVISKHVNTRWFTTDCSKRLNFVCYRENVPDGNTNG